MIWYGAAFILSFFFALCWTPLMRKAALQLGIVDRPDGKLKVHDHSVPYLGGIAVYTAFLFTVGILSDFGQETLGLLLSGSIALMVGLIDDFGILTPYQKLLGETLAALVLVKSGIYIKLIYLPIWVAIPLFDLAMVIWIRWRNGIPVTIGSTAHFALRLRRCKLSVRETAVTAYIVGSILAGTALLMSQVGLEWALMTIGGTLSAACLSA